MEGKELRDETALEQVGGGQSIFDLFECPNGLREMKTKICRSCEHCSFSGSTGKCSKGVFGMIGWVEPTPSETVLPKGDTGC